MFCSRFLVFITTSINVGHSKGVNDIYIAMVPPFMPSEMTKVSYNDDSSSYEVETMVLIDCGLLKQKCLTNSLHSRSYNHHISSEKPFCLLTPAAT